MVTETTMATDVASSASSPVYWDLPQPTNDPQNQSPLDPPTPEPPWDHPADHQHADSSISEARTPEDVRGEISLDDTNYEEQSTTKSSVAQRVVGTVAPFLSRHIPDQYAPRSLQDPPLKQEDNDSNARYCYRHRSALQCRRQADEPAMEQLQKVSQRCRSLPVSPDATWPSKKLSREPWELTPQT